MKKFNSLGLLLSAFIISFLLLSSCSKDEEPKDIRDTLSGTYDYRIKLYEVQQDNIVYLGSDFDEVGTMTTKKQSGTIYDDVLRFEDGNRQLFTTYDFEENSDGIGFSIVSYTRVIEARVSSFEGVENISLNGVDYHGAYFYTDKKVIATQQVTYSLNGTLVTVYSELEGTKQ